MTHNILEKIFGSSARVKIMKLFLFKPESVLSKEEIQKKAQVTAKTTQKELKVLSDIKMIKPKQVIVTKKTKKGKTSKKKLPGYYLNPEFTLMKELRSLLINNEPLQHGDISKRVSKAGKVKLIVISGVFLQIDDTRIDILIVGDDLKDRKLRNVIKTMEAEIGKELRFTALNTDDFLYRQSVCDRLIRDVFDYAHEVVVDRIGIDTE